MLQPKRTKFRKSFRGKRRGLAKGGKEIDFGEYALQATTTNWVSARQIEAARKALAHHTRRGGRIWIRIFPDKPISKKPAETRMGSGKGDVAEYVAVVKAGRIMFEMGGISRNIAEEAMRLAAAKLPLRSKFMVKD